MESQDIDFIIEGLDWLSKNIKFREGKEKATKEDESIYSPRQLRVVRRILDFVASQEDAVVILLRKLLELELNEDIKDLATIAILGKKPIEQFDKYQQNLITKVIFGKNSRWN